MGQTRPLCNLFSSFPSKHYNFDQQKSCEIMSIHWWDLYQRPSDNEFPPKTTRLGLAVVVLQLVGHITFNFKEFRFKPRPLDISLPIVLYLEKRTSGQGTKTIRMRHSSVVLSAPTILRPRVRIPTIPSMLFSICN